MTTLRSVLLLTTVAALAEAGVAAEPPPRLRVDAHGDPLPPGAVARIGTLKFRVDGLSAFALSPDGKTFVTNVPCDSLGVSPDGKVLAEFAYTRVALKRGGGPDLRVEQFVRLWDVATGRELRRWEAPAECYYPPTAFSPDGRFLAAATFSGVIHVWDTATGREVRRVEEPRRVAATPSSVTALAWSPDGRTLASGHWDTTILLWDVTDLPGR